jgi:hypothetical protein
MLTPEGLPEGGGRTGTPLLTPEPERPMRADTSITTPHAARPESLVLAHTLTGGLTVVCLRVVPV